MAENGNVKPAGTKMVGVILAERIHAGLIVDHAIEGTDAEAPITVTHVQGDGDGDCHQRPGPGHRSGRADCEYEPVAVDVAAGGEGQRGGRAIARPPKAGNQAWLRSIRLRRIFRPRSTLSSI